MVDYRKKTLLLVEDEIIQAMMNKAALEKYGYSVITATSGEQAVETVDQTPGIDLILMDIDLGAGIDGTQAGELILKNHDIPVVFLSSHTEPEIVEKTERITSYGYVVKNSSITVLDASIKMAFKLFEANKRTEASEEYFRHTFEYAALGVCLIGLDGSFLRVNKAFTDMIGYSEEEMLGLKFNDVTHPEDAAIGIDVLRSMIAGYIEKVSFEKRYLKKDGSILWVSVSSSVIKSKSRPLHLITQIQDITERKRSSEALRESEYCLSRAEEIARIGNWKIKLDTNEITGSQGACRIYGVNRDHMDLEAIQTMVLSEYRPQGNYFLANLIAKNEPYDLEAKILRKSDGKILDVRSIAEYDPKTNVVFGVIQDITESKRAEETIQKSNELFQTVLDTIPQSICWKDRDSRFLGCNKNYARLVGLPDTQSIIGKTDWDLPWKKDETEHFLRDDRKIMDSDAGEYHIIESAFDADGKETLLSTNKAPLHDSEGKVCGIMVVCEEFDRLTRTPE